MKNAYKHNLAGGFAVLLMAAVLTAAAGCAKTKKAEEKDGGAKAVLRIGAQPFPLYSSILVAHNLGFLDEELNKVNAGYVWTSFNSGPLVNEAVASGNADIGFMADMPAIIARSVGQDIQIVGHVGYGERALALIVKTGSPIKSLAEIKGKKIAFVKGSYAQHLLALLLESAGLTFKDIESVNIGAGDMPAALEAGQIDGAVIWEQYISALVETGRARVLADGTGIKRGNMVTYAVRSYAEAHPEVIAAYLRAGQRGSDYIKSNPKEAAAAIAPDLKLDGALVEKIFTKFDFYQNLTPADIEEIGRVKDYILKEKIISNDISIEDFITTRYIKEAGL
ncbi:MAG: aliphatic sulfonate ABC transporter substrate-binding protein [Spirochaetaceae bacterium]|nr:aliphatic sulfonate ABC transporter substrate-binding protein [Spirochaetaceae bacterium]